MNIAFFYLVRRIFVTGFRITPQCCSRLSVNVRIPCVYRQWATPGFVATPNWLNVSDGLLWWKLLELRLADSQNIKTLSTQHADSKTEVKVISLILSQSNQLFCSPEAFTGSKNVVSIFSEQSTEQSDLSKQKDVQNKLIVNQSMEIDLKTFIQYGAVHILCNQYIGILLLPQLNVGGKTPYFPFHAFSFTVGTKKALQRLAIDEICV